MIQKWTKAKTIPKIKCEPENQDNNDNTTYEGNLHKNFAKGASHDNQSLDPGQSCHYKRIIRKFTNMDMAGQ